MKKRVQQVRVEKKPRLSFRDVVATYAAAVKVIT